MSRKPNNPNTRRRSIKKRLQSLLIELAETEGMYPSGSIGRRDVGQALERLRQAIVWTGENV